MAVRPSLIAVSGGWFTDIFFFIPPMRERSGVGFYRISPEWPVVVTGRGGRGEGGMLFSPDLGEEKMRDGVKGGRRCEVHRRRRRF